MGAIFVTNSHTKALATTAAILSCIVLPAFANPGPVCQDKLAMNTGAPNASYQDASIRQAVETIKAVEKQTGSKIKAKKVLRHEHTSAGNILILGGAEAFPM